MGDQVIQVVNIGLSGVSVESYINDITPVSSTNKTPPRYNWNIVESGVKHHNS